MSYRDRVTNAPGPTPPGWYAIDPHTDRWWDGTAWGPGTRPRVVPMPAQPIAYQVPAHGRMVTTSPVKTSHTFHLLMTVFTCGLWGFVWAGMTIINSLKRQRSVTRY